MAYCGPDSCGEVANTSTLNWYAMSSHLHFFFFYTKNIVTFISSCFFMGWIDYYSDKNANLGENKSNPVDTIAEKCVNKQRILKKLFFVKASAVFIITIDSYYSLRTTTLKLPLLFLHLSPFKCSQS